MRGARSRCSTARSSSVSSDGRATMAQAWSPAPTAASVSIGRDRSAVLDDRSFARNREAMRERDAMLARPPRRGRTPAGARSTSSASTRRASSPRASASRGSPIPGTRIVRGRHLRQLRRALRQAQTLAGRRRRHRVRARRGPLVHGDRQRQHGRVGLVVAAHAGEDPARAEDGAAPAPADRSTSSTARACSCPSSRSSFPGAHGAGHIFKMNSAALGGRRAADRGRVRRLHRGRRLHADHLRPRLHDRAGVHGDRRRGADQRREEPEAHDARHRRPRGARAPVGLRRRARSRRRDRARAASAREVARLPSSARRRSTAATSAPADPRFRPRELAGLLPADHREAYDATEVLARLVDQQPVLGGHARGRRRDDRAASAASAASTPASSINRQGLRRRSRAPRRASGRPASSTARASPRSRAFSRACNDDGIPLVWLQDISGFDIGVEAERHGLLGYGSSLIYTNSTNTTPMFTVLLRKASGAGYYAMAGLPYEPVRAALDAARAPVGDGGPHARDRRVQHQARRRLPDRGDRSRGAREDRGAACARPRRASRATWIRIVAARQMDTDEIVALGELRALARARSPRRATSRPATAASRTRASGRCTTSPRSPSHVDGRARARWSCWSDRGRAARPRKAARSRRLLSPGVGLFTAARAAGDLLAPGAHAGVLLVLGKAFDLVVPARRRGSRRDGAAGAHPPAGGLGRCALRARADRGERAAPRPRVARRRGALATAPARAAQDRRLRPDSWCARHRAAASISGPAPARRPSPRWARWSKPGSRSA